MSKEKTFQINDVEKVPAEPSFTIQDYADKVLETILQKHPDLTIMISSREGKVLTSTLSRKKTLQDSACILNFTDKAKVLVRKLLNEELDNIRIQGRNDNEIIVTFDGSLEIITIKEEKQGTE